MATPWSWTPGCAFDDTGISDPSQTWNRKLWGSELLFARGALVTPGRADFIAACDVKFPAVITATHVRAAMRALRFAHPSIASTLVWSSDYSQGKFQYQAPTSEEEVGRWLDAVVIHRNDLACPGAGETVVDAIDVLSSELSHAQALRTKDMLKLYHLTPSATAPDAHGFLMYLKHSLFDGVGGFQALDCFLHELSIILSRCSNGEPAETAFEWGTEHARLARPVSDRASKSWTMADLDTDWPLVKRMNKVLSCPTNNFGLSANYNATPGASGRIVRSFKPTTLEGLISAARRHACKLYSLQWASVLIACLRVNPPNPGADVSVSFPFCPVNLRPRISTLGSAELVSALGFTPLEALDLGRFHEAAVGRKDEELLEAVWTLAREIQVQLTENEPWQDDAVRSAPNALKLFGAFFAKPPSPQPLRTIAVSGFGVIDGLLKTSYSISDSQALTITHPIFHAVTFNYPEPSVLHTYTWQGTLYYVFGFAEAFVEKGKGVGEDGSTLVDFIDEIERITYLLAGKDD